MNSRSSFHGDSLFDQTNRLATQSLAQHQFSTFGHKIADTSRGIILASGTKPPLVRQMRSLATPQPQSNRQSALFNHRSNGPLPHWPTKPIGSTQSIPHLFNINREGYHALPQRPVVENRQISARRSEATSTGSGIVVYGRSMSTGRHVPILIIKTKLFTKNVMTELPALSNDVVIHKPAPPIVVDVSEYDNLPKDAAHFDREMKTLGRNAIKGAVNFDAVVINVGLDATLGGGLGAGLQIVILIRGTDAGIHIYRSSLPNFNFGLFVSAGASVGLAYFNKKNGKHLPLDRNVFTGRGQGWSATYGPIGAGTSTSYTDGKWHGADVWHMEEKDILYRVETGGAGNMVADLGDVFGTARNFGVKEGIGLQFSLTESSRWLSFPFAK